MGEVSGRMNDAGLQRELRRAASDLPGAVTRDLMRQAADRISRLKRIERDMAVIEDEMREQASGCQDGYLLDIANRIRNSLA